MHLAGKQIRQRKAFRVKGIGLEQKSLFRAKSKRRISINF
jgi:hypothetical protein